MGEPTDAPKLLERSAQAPALDDAAIEKAREMIGVWLRRDVHMPAVYEPISLHDIRRWAFYSVGDDNPLFHDTEYAKRTIWGQNIAPPTFLYTIDSGIVAPGLRGIQWIFAGGSWEHFRPVKAGETITARARLIDVQIKEGRSAPRFVNQVGEVLFTNLAGDVVSRYESNIFRVPRARSGSGFRFKDSGKSPNAPYRYSDEAIAEIAQAYRNRSAARHGAALLGRRQYRRQPAGALQGSADPRRHRRVLCRPTHGLQRAEARLPGARPASAQRLLLAQHQYPDAPRRRPFSNT